MCDTIIERGNLHLMSDVVIKTCYMSSMKQFIQTQRSIKHTTLELRLNLRNLRSWEQTHVKNGFQSVSILEYKMTNEEKREDLFKRGLNGEKPRYYAQEYSIN